MLKDKACPKEAEVAEDFADGIAVADGAGEEDDFRFKSLTIRARGTSERVLSKSWAMFSGLVFAILGVELFMQ